MEHNKTRISRIRKIEIQFLPESKQGKGSCMWLTILIKQIVLERDENFLETLHEKNACFCLHADPSSPQRFPFLPAAFHFPPDILFWQSQTLILFPIIACLCPLAPLELTLHTTTASHLAGVPHAGSGYEPVDMEPQHPLLLSGKFKGHRFLPIEDNYLFSQWLDLSSDAYWQQQLILIVKVVKGWETFREITQRWLENLPCWSPKWASVSISNLYWPQTQKKIFSRIVNTYCSKAIAKNT